MYETSGRVKVRYCEAQPSEDRCRDLQENAPYEMKDKWSEAGVEIGLLLRNL